MTQEKDIVIIFLLGQGMSVFTFSLGQFEWSIPVGLANPFS